MENDRFKIQFEKDGRPKLDKQICLRIVLSDKEPENKDERYHFHLALEFFKNNLNSFDEKEIAGICANPYSAKRLGGHFDVRALELCVKKNEPFPIVIPSWKDKKIKKQLLKDYIKLIDKKGDNEQLTFFLNNFPNVMLSFIEENQKISTSLYESIATKVFNPKAQKENLNSIIEILFNKNTSVLQYLERNYSTEFKNLLSIKLPEQPNTQATFNIAQHLLLNRDYNSLGVVNNIFSSYKDILLEPVNIRVCLYDKKVSIFEFGLTNSKFMAFAPFSLNDNLTLEHKDQIVSAAFSLLQYKYDSFDNNGAYSSIYTHINGYKEILKNWYSSIIEEATDEQVHLYAERAMKNKNSIELKKEIESILLHRKLNNDLNLNYYPNKKLKL